MKYFLLFAILALHVTNHAMLARARASHMRAPSAVTKSSNLLTKLIPQRLSYKSVRLESQNYPKTSKLWEPWKYDGHCFMGVKEAPAPHIPYAQIGKHIFCQLVALHIIHHRHMKKHAKDRCFIITPQDEADDRILSAIDRFSDAFINPRIETNRCSEIYEEGKIPTITDQELFDEIHAALRNLETFLSHPENKVS